jgi:bifunctional DNase/RNase
VVAVAAAAAALSGCKRRLHQSAPPPASVAENLEPAMQPAAVNSAFSPGPAEFADGGAPKGYEHATVWDLVPAGDGAAVLLLDSSKTTVLPIFVGGTEALTIRLDLDGTHYGRPLTHDLLASLVKELGGQAVKAQIDDMRDDTYFGSVFVRQGDRVLQLDARPSDAIAIALGSGAPLYVSRSVMLTSGVPRDQLENAQKTRESGKKKTPISL